jgi:hypothetical protein
MNKRSIGVVLIIATLVPLHLVVAQQPTKAPRIGFLSVGTDSEERAAMKGLRAGLREAGYIEGKIFS